MFSPLSVCSFARLLKTLINLHEIFGGVARDQRNNQLAFGGNPDHNPDPGLVKSICY